VRSADLLFDAKFEGINPQIAQISQIRKIRAPVGFQEHLTTTPFPHASPPVFNLRKSVRSADLLFDAKFEGINPQIAQISQIRKIRAPVGFQEHLTTTPFPHASPPSSICVNL
jgi:hypothetical protein